MYNIRYGLNYLRHRFEANNRHGIHSPFVYKLIDRVIYDYGDQKVYREIEKNLRKQHPDKSVINTLPLKFYRLLYRFAVYFKPNQVLFADDEDHIIQFIINRAVSEVQFIEQGSFGDSYRADMILADALKHNTVDHIEKMRPAIHDDTVVIFTNIHRNAPAKQAWERLKLIQQVKVTIDLYFIGLVFFKPGMSKQDFRVRY